MNWPPLIINTLQHKFYLEHIEMVGEKYNEYDSQYSRISHPSTIKDRHRANLQFELIF